LECGSLGTIYNLEEIEADKRAEKQRYGAYLCTPFEKKAAHIHDFWASRKELQEHVKNGTLD